VRTLAVALLVVLLAGCIPFRRSPVKLRGYSLAAAPGANDRSPVAVDVVVVTEKELVEKVAKLPADQWFATRAQIQLDNPRGVEITSLEPVPGQLLAWRRVKPKRKAAAAFVFAAYPPPGHHRVRVDPFRWISIHLTADSLAVVQSRGP
jgi:type VI secretion system protein